MQPPGRLLRLAVFVAILPAPNTVCGTDVAEPRAKTIRLTGADVIARIGSQTILASELLPAVDETLKQRKDQIAPEEMESLRLAEFRRLLPSLIETKLVYLDAKARIPEEAWVKIIPQLDKLFDASHVPKMMEANNVSNRGELEKVLCERGDSVGARRQAFLERSVASQWINQKTKGKDSAAREVYINKLRDRTVVWTIFDDNQHASGDER